MKNIALFLFTGAALLLLASCGNDTVTEYNTTPSITFASASVTLSSVAASGCSLNYTVTNSINGATTELTADESWLKDFDASIKGQIRFSVEENTSDEIRTANLILAYIYVMHGETLCVETKAAVVQYGAGDPVLTVEPNSIVADAAGGDYSFDYTIDNAIDGEKATCTADVTWISDIDSSVEGSVSFTVGPCTSGELRSGTITIEYAALKKEVTVVQDRAGNPKLTLGTTSIKAEGEGGTYSIDYTITNPHDDIELVATADETWISGFSYGDEAISVTIAQSDQDEKRYATITVTYGTQEKTVAVEQKRQPDTGTWTEYGTGTYRYCLFFSDDPDEGLKIYQNSDNTNRFKIEDWAAGADLVFTWDQETNAVTMDEDIYTNYDYSSYGAVYVADFIVDSGYDYYSCPAGYFDETYGIFYFPLEYYCDAGIFSYGYETFVLDGGDYETLTFSVEDFIGTYSVLEESEENYTLEQQNWVFATPTTSTSCDVEITTFAGRTLTTSGGSSSGGGPGGGGGGPGGGTTTSYSYIACDLDSETGILSIAHYQQFGVTSGNSTTSYYFYVYSGEPAYFLLMSDGGFYGPFYADLFGYTYTSFNTMYWYDAFYFVHGVKSTTSGGGGSSPFSVKSSETGIGLPVSSDPYVGRLKYKKVKLHK